MFVCGLKTSQQTITCKKSPQISEEDDEKVKLEPLKADENDDIDIIDIDEKSAEPESWWENGIRSWEVKPFFFARCLKF